MTKWTIAILTVHQRKGQLNRLLDLLYRQLDDDRGRSIELMVCNMSGSVSEKRQWCLDNAEGEYFNFIDDDDLVAENYVDAIYPLLDGVDYVGFQLQYYHEGNAWKPTFHSLRYGTHAMWADESGFYRGVSHLNPIRTEIARQGHYSGGFGEDNRWSDLVEPVTEHYVDQIMYHYFFSQNGSLTANG
jgi:hypothetical protein